MNEKEFEPLKEMTKKICTDLAQPPTQQMSQMSLSPAPKSTPKASLPTTVEERYITKVLCKP